MEDKEMRWNLQMANLLPISSFHASVQGKGTQIKPGSVTELRHLSSGRPDI